MSRKLHVVRAEALFVSTVQSSDRASSDDVREAVATTLRRFGIGGCAIRMAGEFGDHPDTAAKRMTWALATIRAVYPTCSGATPSRISGSPLALAS